ncbi:MAG: glycosyltransferase family 9 protein [Gammaproteobacteria bacterium]
MPDEPRRILIFRRGALGDTLVALPALRLIRRRFPDAQIRILHVDRAAASETSLQTILGPLCLVSGYFSYPVGTRNPATLLNTVRTIRRWRPDAAVYLAEVFSLHRVTREFLFLKACGIARIWGTPWNRRNRTHALQADGTLEYEARRLLRCIAELGHADPHAAGEYGLELTADERRSTRAHLTSEGIPARFVTAALAVKNPAKQWGEERWARVLETISAAHPSLGLVMLGAPSDSAFAERMRRHWGGPSGNLCNQLTLREHAATLSLSTLFFGNDGGNMHLAAAAGTRTVCVFNGDIPRHAWSPLGQGHKPIYPTDDRGLGGITVDRVVAALSDALARSAPRS